MQTARQNYFFTKNSRGNFFYRLARAVKIPFIFLTLWKLFHELDEFKTCLYILATKNTRCFQHFKLWAKVLTWHPDWRLWFLRKSQLWQIIPSRYKRCITTCLISIIKNKLGLVLYHQTFQLVILVGSCLSCSKYSFLLL